ncbi:putative urea active transporter [Lachnellula occidentalis]|uniref:Putative urea active transporter n=1 Tax=Lachnellula occidentalis TaxID=215460 RepID=A0A8H8S6P0_9HELO|nr:putative urea active transporter [Lachnellula occidentalis]
MSQTQIEPIFSQGVGYGVVVGLGAAFAIGMSMVSLFLSKYFAEKQDSEMFMTAKHSVKTGLTASAVVSSWTIATTLLSSTSYGYSYGVSGPFWYGAGASVQILLFSVAAIELKRKAPNAQVHTVVIFVIMLMSAFVVYSTSSVIGSSDKMWELLTTASELHPVEGNAEGSYLTMRSVEGGYIGLVFVGAGFAAAVDSQLFQKAIASDPAGTLGGYLLGGTSWFTIPFVLATTFGLTAAATEHLPSFPTYPNRMNSYEVASGLAMPYGALSVMGKGGAFAILASQNLSLMVFMAVTSAMSSETVATTALLTYNFYQSYINPKATGKQLLRFSNFVVPGFALVASSIAVGLNHAGFSVSFLITISGILVDSAIVPMACTIMWSKQSKFAVIASPTISSACGILAWLLTARSTEGVLTIATLSTNLPLVAGNMCSLCAPLVLTPLFTLIRPENYDFEKFKEVKAADEYKDGDDDRVQESDIQAEYEMEAARTHDEKNEKILFRARKWAIIASIVMTLAYLILWPIPMYATSYAGTITLLPIWESRDSLAKFARYIFSGKISKTNPQVTIGMQPENDFSGSVVEGVLEKNIAKASD